MPKRKKSKKRSGATPAVIVVMLTENEKDKAMESILNDRKVGFEIEEIEQTSIPVVRARHQTTPY
jgi:hypothetical protein